MLDEISTLASGRKPRRFTHRRPDTEYLAKIGMVDVPAACAITGKSPQTLHRIGLPVVKLGRTRLYRLSDLNALLQGEPLPPRKSARIKPSRTPCAKTQ
jgi:hypothetical protein